MDRQPDLLRLAATACLVMSLAGCQSVGTYFSDRAGDLSDSIQLAIGGPAAGVHVEVTPIVNAGLDVWKSYRPHGGTFGNFAGRVPRDADFGAYNVFFFHARGFDTDPAGRDPSDDSQFLPVHSGTLTHLHQLGRPFESTPPPENLRLLRWLDVEANAAAILGVRARVSPGEMLDFLLGWFGVDIGGDDTNSDAD